MIRPEELRDLENAAKRHALDVFEVTPLPACGEADYQKILSMIAQAWIEGFCRGRDGRTWATKMRKEGKL